MLDPKGIDFKKLGFHAGLEVHHQIRSKRKLFCNCPPTLESNPHNMDYSFHRYFRPVLGEMGDFDPGMLIEFEKGYNVIYLACERNTCTYEMDETPPFPPDPEAIRNGFILALYLNCSALTEEVVVNRKQYLDGSITTGFQRTFIIGRDGWVPVFGKRVKITNVHVEEDAARRVDWVDTASRTVYFNLDRLGIPLVEVITDYRDVETPEELVELAKQIGRVLRVSKVGRRGIGVARQDVNISIEGGNRVEIKGVQDLTMFDAICRYEVLRQATLIDIAERLKSRKLSKTDFEHTYVDLSHLFRLETSKVFAAVFPKMKGIFGMIVQPNKDFGSEIFEKSMLIAGIPCEEHFHSDETEETCMQPSTHRRKLKKIRETETKIRGALKVDTEDAYVLVFGPEKRVLHALKKIVERVKMAIDGVPQETRRLLPDGTTQFLRVIHGKERIYPDTDSPPLVIPKTMIEEQQVNVEKRPWEIYEEFHGKYGLDRNQVDLLIRDESLRKFSEYVEQMHLRATTAYRLLVELPRNLRRQGTPVNALIIDRVVEALSRHLIISEQIDVLIKMLAENPELGLESAVSKMSTSKPTDIMLEKLLKEKSSLFDLERALTHVEYRRRIVTKIVGEVMQRINRAASGSEIAGKVENMILEEKPRNV